MQPNDPLSCMCSEAKGTQGMADAAGEMAERVLNMMDVKTLDIICLKGLSRIIAMSTGMLIGAFSQFKKDELTEEQWQAIFETIRGAKDNTELVVIDKRGSFEQRYKN